MVVRVETMLFARRSEGWQALPVSTGDVGVVVATDVEDWENSASAKLPGGGLTPSSGRVVAVWLDGREYAVPMPMIKAGHVDVVRT